MRTLRFARFVRIFRLARVVQAFRSFRLVIIAILESFASLGLVFLVVFFIIYMFAIFFMIGVGEYFENGGKEETRETEEALLKFYGSVPRSMMTLWMVISNGIDWITPMEPLRDIEWWYEYVFLVYVFFMFMGVLNVVIGAFVAATAEISWKDRDVLVQQEMRKLDNYKGKLKTFFKEADSDGSGTLSWTEFKLHLRNPKVKAYFQALDLDVAQARVLFDMLDNDESGEVSFDEFLEGCIRLKGHARSIDVNMLMLQNEWVIAKLAEFIGVAEENFDRIGVDLSALRARSSAKKH